MVLMRACFHSLPACCCAFALIVSGAPTSCPLSSYQTTKTFLFEVSRYVSLDPAKSIGASYYERFGGGNDKWQTYMSSFNSLARVGRDPTWSTSLLEFSPQPMPSAQPTAAQRKEENGTRTERCKFVHRNNWQTQRSKHTILADVATIITVRLVVRSKSTSLDFIASLVDLSH